MSPDSEPARGERALRAITVVTAIAVIGCGIVGGWWFHMESGITWERETLRERLGEFGAIAPLVFILMVAFRPLLILPSFVILAAGGVLFGALWGALWGALGGALGALLTFFVARTLGRDAVARRLRGATTRLDRYLAARGPIWIAAYCAFPATPLTPAFAAAGLTSMRLFPFLVAATVGLLPRTIVYSTVGDSVFELDWARLAVVIGIAALAVLVAAPARRWLFKLPDEDPEPDENER